MRRDVVDSMNAYHTFPSLFLSFQDVECSEYYETWSRKARLDFQQVAGKCDEFGEGGNCHCWGEGDASDGDLLLLAQHATNYEPDDRRAAGEGQHQLERQHKHGGRAESAGDDDSTCDDWQSVGEDPVSGNGISRLGDGAREACYFE